MTIVHFIESRLREKENRDGWWGAALDLETEAMRRNTAIRAMLDHLVLLSTDCQFDWSSLDGNPRPVVGTYAQYDLEPTLKVVAAMWSDHPDYQQEWGRK